MTRHQNPREETDMTMQPMNNDDREEPPMTTDTNRLSTTSSIEIGPNTTHSVYVYHADGTKSAVTIETNEHGTLDVVIDAAENPKPWRGGISQAVTFRTGWLEPEGDEEYMWARFYGGGACAACGHGMDAHWDENEEPYEVGCDHCNCEGFIETPTSHETSAATPDPDQLPLYGQP
jgi:hypothetical protein